MKTARTTNAVLSITFALVCFGSIAQSQPSSPTTATSQATVSPQQTAQQALAAVSIDLHAVETQLAMFKAMKGRLPTTEEGLEALVPQLINKVPTDPWQHPYQYRLDPKRPRGYDLFSFGADGVESKDDIHL